MNSLPPPIPPPPISRHSGPASNDDSNFAGPLRYDRLAIASLVCAIGSCLKFFWGRQFGVPLFPLAFVLGILALKRIKAEPGRLKGRGMALAGMIIPPLFILVLIIDFILSGETLPF